MKIKFASSPPALLQRNMAIVNSKMNAGLALKYFKFVCVPLLIGVLPYLFFRLDAPVFVIKIQRFLNVYFGLTFVHIDAAHLNSNWNWVVYNLPDALWAFSLTSFITLATRTDSRNMKLLYFFASVVIMLVLEITVGTFDWLDVGAMFVAIFTSTVMLKTKSWD